MIALADLKALLDEGGTDHDSFLTLQEAAAVEFVQRYTGRYFGASEQAEQIVPGVGTNTLWLADDAAAVASVHESIYPGAAESEILAGDVDGFVIRGRRLVRKGGSVWRRGHEYRVIYTRGYAAGNEPADIRGAVLELVRYRYGQRKAGADGMKSESIGGYSYTLADAKEALSGNAGVMDVLGHWRRIAV